METFIPHPAVSARFSAVLASCLSEWLDCGSPLPSSRKRRLPPPLVALAWLLQCLCGNISCENVLADAQIYSAGEILQAYRMRWEIELGFRDLKTSMDAAFLRYQTPEMVESGRGSFSWRTVSCNCWPGRCWGMRWSSGSRSRGRCQ